MIKNKIYIRTKHKNYKLESDLRRIIKMAINYTLSYEQITFQCELSVVVTDDTYIHRLNLGYRNVDSPTDVLSFPLYEPEEIGSMKNNNDIIPIGDIVISIDRIYDNISQGRQSRMEVEREFKRELALLVIHSALHLLGYDHADRETETEMFNIQNKILEKLASELSL